MAPALNYVAESYFALIPAIIAFKLGEAQNNYLQDQSAGLRGRHLIKMLVLGILFLLPFVWQSHILFETLSSNKVEDEKSKSYNRSNRW